VALLLGTSTVLYATAVMGSGIEHPRHVAVSAVVLAVSSVVALSTVLPRRPEAGPAEGPVRN